METEAFVSADFSAKIYFGMSKRSLSARHRCAGLKVNYKQTSEFKTPEEFQNQLDKIPALKTAFAALTPGRQRGYILYFSAPKQSKTRESRVEKCMPQILNGKGLNDE